ncbi:MAG: hypothetical protein DHS20C21_03920 [Gemmatimonadota bacterium]|nr:MAG: hypothetical protein DHS20C21_03920 [Gemmatimonadota bacterium]
MRRAFLGSFAGTTSFHWLPLAAFLMLGTLAVTGTAGARTWLVSPDGTGDAATIQAGVALAANGDTVRVACGWYIEHDIVVTSAITLISDAVDPSCVTIDGSVFFDVALSGRLELTIYDVAGRRVRNLSSGFFEPGGHSVAWN